MKENLISAIKVLDFTLADINLKLVHERSSLITVLFHGLFENKKELLLNLVHPQQEILVKQFKDFIEYYLDKNYIFISPKEVLEGLHADRKYILITFDDGYYNNINALPVLENYNVPAVFFISTNHIKFNKCFWWDVLYRERIKEGYLLKAISNEVQQLKTKTHSEIERYIVYNFGKNALEPKSDIDRPFSPEELREFSKERLVHIGNHTSDHAILTNYDTIGIKNQIMDAQAAIYEITGKKPIIIAYPNGNYSKEIVDLTKKLNFKIGITIDHKKNYLPLNLKSKNMLMLGRFILWGNSSIDKQCDTFRSDINLYSTISKTMKRVY